MPVQNSEALNNIKIGNLVEEEEIQTYHHYNEKFEKQVELFNDFAQEISTLLDQSNNFVLKTNFGDYVTTINETAKTFS